LENPIVKIILFLIIAYIATIDIVIAIIAVIALLISYQTLISYKITNHVIDKTNEIVNEKFSNNNELLSQPSLIHTAFNQKPSNPINNLLFSQRYKEHLSQNLSEKNKYNLNNKDYCNTRLGRDNIQLSINDNTVSLKDKIIEERRSPNFIRQDKTIPNSYDDPENYIDENIFNYNTVQKYEDNSYLLKHKENYDKINKDLQDFYLLKDKELTGNDENQKEYFTV
jgi:hypothetical protein